MKVNQGFASLAEQNHNACLANAVRNVVPTTALHRLGGAMPQYIWAVCCAAADRSFFGVMPTQQTKLSAQSNKKNIGHQGGMNVQYK